VLRLSIVLALFTFTCSAQVRNDSISLRSVLELDSPGIVSSTHQATVEWACINKKLTEKCLIYHNDQWFTFTPKEAGKLFLNISQQECRKKFGVQILVLEGNPCQTESYRLRHCESFTHQSDTHVVLDSLRAGQTYLVNIDGFLGDLCDFEIQLSTKPTGLVSPSVSIDTLDLLLTSKDKIITMRWNAPASYLDSLDYFEVYRQGNAAFKRTLVKRISAQFNTVGKMITAYSLTDTLQEYDTYAYAIVGVYKDEMHRIMLDQQQVKFLQPHAFVASNRRLIRVPIESRKKTDFDFLVLNAATSEVLFKRQCLQCTTQIVHLDVTEEVQNGISQFRVEYFNARTKQWAHVDYTVAK
jgi:hypothetical protein